MNSVVALQFIVSIISFAEFKYAKYVIACLSCIIAIISSSVFFSQISDPVTNYLPLVDIFSKYNFGILSDSLSVSIIWCVSIVTALITTFSIGYFHKRLHLFLGVSQVLSFLVMMFVSANNILQLYVFLEIITLCIYFIIRCNFKPHLISKSSNFFVLNRCANFLFLLVMIAIEHFLGSLSFDKIDSMIISTDNMLHINEIITFFLSVCLIIKTAQFLFTGWMKSTMLAPFPVIAIMHMSIAVDVFIIIRLQNLFEYNETAQNILIIFGLITAVWCGLKAIYAHSIQDVIAFSTNSQIGLMITACGFSAYSTAVILFVTYSFSKLLMCLSVSSVIHALSGETKIEKMGGLFELLPKSYISMNIATVSLINVPLLSSYYAEKQFISEIISSNSPMYYIAIFMVLISSIFTCIYLFRMIYRIFHGENHVSELDLGYLNEDNHYMNISMYIASIFSIFSGVFFYYLVLTDVVWKDVFVFSYEKHTSLTLIFTIVNVAGIILGLFVCKSIRSKSLELFRATKTVKISDISKFFVMPKIHLSLFKSRTINLNVNHRLCFILILLFLVFKVVSGI